MSATPETLMREATQLHRQNRVSEAITAYQSIVSRWPKSPDAWFNLAILHRQLRNFPEALRAYQHALDAGIERPEEVHLNRSVIFSDYLRDHSMAARELERALSLNPSHGPALLNLANLYEDFGKFTEASGLYARILSIDPLNYEALARFANMQRTDVVDPNLIARVKAAVPFAATAQRASLGFALGRLLDAAGQYQEAFAAYTAANEASRATAGAHAVPYDPARQEAFVSQLIEQPFSARATISNTPPQPVFVLGMFRSGSTLLEQLLAGMPQVAAGGEVDFIPRFVHDELNPFFPSLATLDTQRLDAVTSRYREELLRASTTARFVTDKRPDNFMYIGLIKQLYPKAKIVHTTRSPLDNCLSIYFLHLDAQLSYALDLRHIGHYYRQYRRLMAHWKSMYGDDIVDVNYDALVKDPEAVLKRLCSALDLQWPGAVPTVSTRSAAIKTASVWQVRQPLYQSSSGRARHYAAELRELAEYLADLA